MKKNEKILKSFWIMRILLVYKGDRVDHRAKFMSKRCSVTTQEIYPGQFWFIRWGEQLKDGAY